MSYLSPLIARELTNQGFEYPHPNAAQQSLERARAIIRAPDPIAPPTLFFACQTLALSSRNGDECAAARQVIKEMEAAA